jgi:predicted ATP-dependent serine protease
MKLRFFCEQCGTEVPRNTVRCPTCGRYFTAIQCPQCGYRGSEEDFTGGCPTCGYMRPREVGADERGVASGRGKVRKKRERRRRAASLPGATRSGGPGATEPAGPPRVVYTIIGIVLLLLLGILVAVLLL